MSAKSRTPTYAEICAHARKVSERINREWPEWKKALSFPKRMEIRPDPRVVGVGNTRELMNMPKTSTPIRCEACAGTGWLDLFTSQVPCTCKDAQNPHWLDNGPHSSLVRLKTNYSDMTVRCDWDITRKHGRQYLTLSADSSSLDAVYITEVVVAAKTLKPYAFSLFIIPIVHVTNAMLCGDGVAEEGTKRTMWWSFEVGELE